MTRRRYIVPLVAGFFREQDALTCDGVPLSEIARRAGTPVYVYSGAAVEENFRAFDRAFAVVPHLVCYAAKANSNLAILKLLASLGAGADVVSGGELRACLQSGFAADRIVFSGVGKTDEEIPPGRRRRPPRVQRGVRARDGEIAAEAGRRENGAGGPARQPGHRREDPSLHFDRPEAQQVRRGHRRMARGIFGRSRRLKNLTMTGVQATSAARCWRTGRSRRPRGLAALATALAGEGFPLQTVDIGGGFGLAAAGEAARAGGLRRPVLPHLAGLPFRVLIEPGRAIVGPAGVLVTRVLYVKENSGRRFVITDAGMNDLIRPPLYSAIHSIESVDPRRTPSRRTSSGDLRTSDFLARDIALPSRLKGTCSPFATSEPTGSRWPPTTISARARPRSWSSGAPSHRPPAGDFRRSSAPNKVESRRTSN